MITLTRHLPFAVLVLLLGACALPDIQSAPGPHVIRTKDGREIACVGAPVLQEKTGYYRYKKTDHTDGVIHPEQVVSIMKGNS